MGPIRMVVAAPPPFPGAAAQGAPAEAMVRFLASSGAPVGRRRRVAVAPAPHLEAPAPGAGSPLARVSGQPMIAFMTRLPAGATRFRLELPGHLPLEAGIRETASPRPRRPRRIHRLGSPSPRFLLAAMAERFDSETAFLAAARTLLAAIEAAEPFRSLPGRIAVDALFWPSDPARGLFGPLSQHPGTDLLYGDRPLTRAFLDRAYRRAPRRPDCAIVVMNLDRRGGAGGDRHFPIAWTTTTSGPHEAWTDIALHEIGHALGLADEYDSDNPDPPPRPAAGLEPNVTDKADPRLAPWAAVATTTSPVPTAPADGGAHLPAGTIGTFEGARYRRLGLYRPQHRCRMRSSPDPFCAICAAIIRDRLA